MMADRGRFSRLSPVHFGGEVGCSPLFSADTGEYAGRRSSDMSILSIYRILKRAGKEKRELGERVRDGK